VGTWGDPGANAKGKERYRMKLKFNTDNAAYADYEYPNQAIARSVREVAEKIEQGARSGIIRDTNGNTVGKWEL